MKLKYLSVACLSLFSISAFANLTNVYDTDGHNRHTYLSLGPVSSLTTANDTARDLVVYVYRDNADSTCTYGEVYEVNSGQTVTFVNIESAGATMYVDKVTASLPESVLNKNKALKLACHDENGDAFNVHHKLPSVPQVSWTASVEATGEFVHQHQSYGYHDEIRYSGIINVNNQTTDSYCYSDADRGVPLYLFHDVNGKGRFHSDVFVADRTMGNTAPVLYQSVTCVNPMGSTRVIKAWELTEESGINLIVNEAIIR